MTTRSAGFALAIALLVPVASRAAEPSIEYIANEGVVIRHGEHAILIDALYRTGVKPYLQVQPEALRALESASAPFNDIDLVLVTHEHADHFDARSVAAHLRANPAAKLIAPDQVTAAVITAGGRNLAAQVTTADPKGSEMRTYEHAGIRVDVLRLSHGGGRHERIQNYGYVVHVGGKRIAHLGDADCNPFTTDPLDAHATGIDVALIPYWWFMADKSNNYVVQSLKPGRVVMIHIPPEDAQRMADATRGKENEIMAFTKPGEVTVVK